MKYTVVKFSGNYQKIVHEGDVFREARSWAWHVAHDLIDGGRPVWTDNWPDSDEHGPVVGGYDASEEGYCGAIVYRSDGGPADDLRRGPQSVPYYGGDW